MNDLKYPVSYLEVNDFQNGNLVVPKLANKPVLILLQAGFCGHCQTAKPEFQKFAEMGIVECATIQADGTKDGEKQLGSIITNIYPGKFQGYPSYMLILPSGKKIAHDGGRDAMSLQDFVTKNATY